MSSSSKYDKIFKEFKNKENDIQDFPKIYDQDGPGRIREIIYKGRPFLAKLVEKNPKNDFDINKFRGPHLLKIFNIISRKHNGTEYDLIIMEKAVLNNLGKLIQFMREHQKLLKLIYNPFSEIISDNILRFFTKQIVEGLKILEINDLVHFDIKQENILVNAGLNLKISDSYFLKDLSKGKQFKIPEGIKGYLTPEFYQEKKEIDSETTKKQDYFALGATLFLLKVGHQMLDYKEYEEKQLTEDRVIDLIQRDMALIQSNPLASSDFIEFICNLINYIPEDRPTFEEIYRNKWLNTYSDEIELVKNLYIDKEEDKYIREIIKSDFLIEKKEVLGLEKKNKKRNFKFTPSKKPQN